MRAVIKQLAIEAAIPFATAAGWTVHKWHAGEASITLAIGTFMGTFVAISYLTNNFFRVKKQVRVDGGLTSIEDRLAKLTNELDAASTRLQSVFTGGKSYCVLQVANLVFVDADGQLKGSDGGQMLVQAIGSDPLYDVTLAMVDVDVLDARFRAGVLREDQFESRFEIGNLSAGGSVALGAIELGDGVSRSFNLFWHARNGHFSQQLRFQRVSGVWKVASKIVAHGVKDVDVQDGFDLGAAGLDWS